MQQEELNIPAENIEENIENLISQEDGPVEEAAVDTAESSILEEKEAEIEKLRAEVAELKDKYLRQVAEFDNFRKRSAREMLEMSRTAGKDVIVALLDVVDDSDRARKQIEQTNEAPVIKEGIQLVFNKLKSSLQAKGHKAMESVGLDFDPDMHEAIAEIPAPDEKSVGKVLDEVQKGYYLNDKIIRFAKVVVGK
ncbi:MAG: nucleotide exchange factor GrpE [Chitinophagaceae bacterium]|nr:nucleotide exchange factor GrpE [Chitinophagaceae bacterium]